MTLGPVQILVIGFDNTERGEPIRAELDRLREEGIVRLVDLLVVRKEADGTIERVTRSDLSEDELVEFGATVGALIGLGAGGEEGMEAGALLGADATADGVFDESNSWYVDDAIPPGSAAAIALLEHRWAIPLRDTLRDAGGVLLADAWIHPQDLVAVGLLAAEEAAVA
jgi:uncharacterized membrane protein